MSTEYRAGSRAVPLSYRLYRLAAVALFLVLLLTAGLGAAGSGPVAALAGPTRTAVTWVKDQMGLGQPAPPPPPVAVHKHHKRKHHKRKHHKHKKKRKP